MSQISLACYSIRLRERYKLTPVGFKDTRATGLFAFFENAFTNLATNTVNMPDQKKAISVRQCTAVNPEIKGILRTGEYGYETDLVDITGKKKPYRRGTEQAEMIPFFFHLYLPAAGECGILILQRFGLFGVRTILTRSLETSFKQKFQDLKLDILPMVPDGVLKRLFDTGELRRITLRKFTLPSDIADLVDSSKSPDSASVEIVIKAKKDWSFEALLQRVQAMAGKGPAGLNEIIEVDGFEHDKILLGIEIDGKEQTIDLTNLSKLRAHVDITDRVETGIDGHPLYDSIAGEAAELLLGIRKTLKI